jgi:hypothetical protein
MQSEVEQEYNKLKKKYNLPEFNKIDFEFEISSLESSKFLLRNIINKINEKIDNLLKILEELLNPDASTFSSLYELRYFDDEEKKDIYNLFKKLMLFSRKSLATSLSNNEKEEAIFINEIFNEWNDIKSQLLEYVKKMEDAWKKETDIKEDLEYLR